MPRRPDQQPIPDRPIVVLHSLAAPDGTTKYVDQIAQGAPAEIRVRFFSWRTALRERYDVLHLHWPELLLRGRSRRLRIAKRVAMVLLLARIHVRRTPLVRTVHNERPHETGGLVERALLDRIDRTTDLFVHLTPATSAPGNAPVVLIPHGHYRDRFSGIAQSTVEAGRLLYVGIIRPYKGVDRLLELAPALDEHDVSVRIVGNPSPDMRPVVEDAVRSRPSVTARLAFVPDAELVAEVTAAEIVALPYREMHNSGVLLVVLSLGRPALVPRAPSTEALAAEVGPGWLHLYDGELDVHDVLGALDDVRRTRRDAPRLDHRDWDEIGRRHLDAYRSVLETRHAS